MRKPKSYEELIALKVEKRSGYILSLMRSAGVFDESGQARPNLGAALAKALGFKLTRSELTNLRAGLRDSSSFLVVDKKYFDREVYEAAQVPQPTEPLVVEQAEPADKPADSIAKTSSSGGQPKTGKPGKQKPRARQSATVSASLPSPMEVAYAVATDEAQRTIARGAELFRLAIRGLPKEAALQALGYAQAAVQQLPD